MVKMSIVWDRTVEFISDNLGALMPVALLAIFVPVSAMQSLQPLLGAAGNGRSLGLALALFLLSLLSVIGRMAVIALALEIADDARRAVSIAVARLPAFILAALVLVIPGFLIIIPIGLIFAAYGLAPTTITAASQIPEAAMVPLLLYGVVLLCIAMWLFARLLPMVSVIVAERRWVGAIVRAFRLTRGATFKIIGVMLLYSLVSWVATTAAKTVFGSLLHLIAGNEDVVNVATVLTSIIVAAVGTGFQVLAATFTAKLYLALRAEKEGGVTAA